MKIVNIKKVGKKPVYDLSVSEVEHYVLKNGVVTHNTGIYYSANQIFIITKSQEKEGGDLAGFKFTINIEKSRYVREKSKLPFYVRYDTGIKKWSSLFDLALEAGFIAKASQGWYNTIDLETGEVIEPKKRLKEIEEDNSFFKKLVDNGDFNDYIESRFKLSGSIRKDKDAREDDTFEPDTE